MKSLMILCLLGLSSCFTALQQNGADFTETALGLNMKMVYVKGGEFEMGATAEQGVKMDLNDGTGDWLDNELPVRRVKLDSFYIGECEITQAQWQMVMGSSIQDQANKHNRGNVYNGIGFDYPMYYVSWDDAQTFCRELSRITGKTYCLPTEAQWEYAARGGNKNDGTKYSGSDAIDAVAWHRGNSNGNTHPVKNKRANGLGLYDMSGNVLEWCADWYADYYNVNDTDNPTGPSSGSQRVVRGGCWRTIQPGCRVSTREGWQPSSASYKVGFRVVMIP